MYIRTKDGIYEVDFVDNSTYYHTTGWNIVEKEQIIAKSDTIEELCDEFVLFYMETKNATPIPWATYERRGVWEKEKEHIINEITNHPSYREPILYGAIWTSKGLIYVAKMNSEGNLELI
ncbi:MAG: hypothetical protein IKF82_00995 [Bacilli bacterium]|nr:hypothetical protein [Bacilli bacterium]